MYIIKINIYKENYQKIKKLNKIKIKNKNKNKNKKYNRSS